MALSLCFKRTVRTWVVLSNINNTTIIFALLAIVNHFSVFDQIIDAGQQRQYSRHP